MMITIGFLLDLFLFANSDGVVVVVVAKAVAMLEALLLMMLLQQERKEAVVVIVVFVVVVVVVTCVVDNSSVAILWISRNVCRRCDTPSVFASRSPRSSTGGSHHH